MEKLAGGNRLPEETTQIQGPLWDSETSNSHLLLLSLPPPQPFDMVIHGLSIGAPPPSVMLPLPIPVPIPKFLRPKKSRQEGLKTIIRNVSAVCRSGEMLAIIGGSGSGKTTLLNSIVGRLGGLPITEGEVKFSPSGSSNETLLANKQMKDKIGFVRQTDDLLPYLTVRETLNYAAALRLPVTVSAEDRGRIVEDTIEELGLKEAANTVVGGILRKGISGGERRRLSIGCVLVTLPSVLCLDEPTTGLDAFTAFALLLTLSRLAKRNRTVILSLHQPRSDAFGLFSRLVLLSKGQVVYSGLTSRCLPWFASSLLELHPEQGVNVLDWLIDVSTVDTRTPENEEASRIRVERLVRTWEESPWEEEGEDLRLEKADIAKHLPSAIPDAAIDWTGRDFKRPGLWTQTLILSGRAQKNVYRNFGQLIGLACQAIGIGILLGVTFYRLDETPAGIQSLKTLVFQFQPCYFYLTLVYTVFRLCETDLVIFDREREDHLYNVAPWLLSEFIANLPLHTVFSTIFAVLLYFMCNLRTSDLAANLFIFVAVTILVQLCTVGLALLASSIQRVYATASLIANALQIFLLLNGGYLLVHVPVYVGWIRWISSYYYAFHSLMITQFKDRHFTCVGVEGIARNQCEGNQVLIGLDFPSTRNPAWYILGLFGLFIAEHILAGVILSLHHPGGAKHAEQVQTEERGKESRVTGALDIPWMRVSVEVRGLGLKWTRQRIPALAGGAEKVILKDVNIRFPAGEVTAILGPSGAGKSSLLQLLAFRGMNPGPFAHFERQGEITFNGQPYTKAMQGLVAFVEQDDHYHYAALTVRETLRYAAILRLPREISRKQKLARAEEVLSMLGLSECADTIVGGPLLKGISGGEKRRLSLAVQMISDPSILIADEPTSGLDSLTANNVMTALKNIASQSGRTVIVTLHQPRSDIYQNGIDNVVVLVKGGRVAYSGRRADVETTFADAGYPIPPLFNPADHLLDVVSIDSRGTREEYTKARVASLLEFWQERRKKEEDAYANQTASREIPFDHATLESAGRMTPARIALPVVVSRMIKNLWRQQPVFWIRIQQAPFLASLFLLFYQRLRSGPSGGQDRIGFVIEYILSLPFVGLLNGIAIFPTDRDMFLNEYHSSAAYSSLTFVTAFTLVELPFEILSSALYTITLNLGAGLHTTPRIYFEDTATVFCLQFFGESLGIAFASITHSMGLNISLVSTALTVLCQISGIVSVSVPKWISTLAWGTVMKLAVRVVMTNELVGLKLNCSPESISSGKCLGQTGEELLALLGFGDLRTGRFLGILVAVAVVNRILAWGVVWYKVR